MNTRLIRRIKSSLRRHHITYGQIARRSGMSYNTVYLVVNGLIKSPTPRVMRAIEKMTGETVDGEKF